ncbi:hypothetical protein NBEOAGPD_2189 [Methylobacterium gregans]|uniref:Response regulator receiver protein n=1 Tax=Methylobacterium gregans TaxID=374424 RepID=A0AA37HNW8_9HYPH|nr:response regulator [Methylobacterium gregans]MDQ0523691.1 hypothetical protein [Methylobacterium gregans]GJD78969.1 hypothetical protein NBEOAGPD_2189 [Methylobacterium gregans]
MAVLFTTITERKRAEAALMYPEGAAWLAAVVVGPVPSMERALALIEHGALDAAVLDLTLGERGTVFPIADRLGALGVPHLFATGDVQVARGSGYEDRPRLGKPYREAELVRVVAQLTASAQTVS